MKLLKSLKAKLFVWYLGSLLVLAVFFYSVIHILALPNGTEYFIALIVLLALVGFYIIFRLTSSLTYLTSRMKLISRKNLAERITEIKRDDEIGELATTFNELLDRLNDAFVREQQFIADVAHELKTPLATMRSTFEVTLSRPRKTEEYKKVISEAILETDHMSSTFKNILDLAWSETPQAQGNMEKFDLSELLEELWEISQKMAVSKKIKIRKSIQQSIFIFGFREKLARALLNIIDNAIKYTPSGKTVTISLEVLLNRAVLSIKDTGYGIAKQDLPRIFDRFYRGSATNKVFGSGLGLAITKSIISIHHGEIKVESKVASGTTVLIILPIA